MISRLIKPPSDLLSFSFVRHILRRVSSDAYRYNLAEYGERAMRELAHLAIKYDIKSLERRVNKFVCGTIKGKQRRGKYREARSPNRAREDAGAPTGETYSKKTREAPGASLSAGVLPGWITRSSLYGFLSLLFSFLSFFFFSRTFPAPHSLLRLSDDVPTGVTPVLICKSKTRCTITAIPQGWSAYFGAAGRRCNKLHRAVRVVRTWTNIGEAACPAPCK